MKCLDGDNVIGKNTTNNLTLNINLKSTTNISRPEILLSRVNGVDFLDYNYAEIPDLNRKYFIDSITSQSYNIFLFSLRVDVLETYASHIKNSHARFNRKIKIGDYLNATIESNINPNSTIYQSNKGFEGSSMILTSVGG